MSALPRTRNGRFIPRDRIPGAEGCTPPAEPFELYGVVWTPEDAGPHAAPIGLSLAMEWAAAQTATATTAGTEVA